MSAPAAQYAWQIMVYNHKQKKQMIFVVLEDLFLFVGQYFVMNLREMICIWDIFYINVIWTQQLLASRNVVDLMVRSWLSTDHWSNKKSHLAWESQNKKCF